MGIDDFLRSFVRNAYLYFYFTRSLCTRTPAPINRSISIHLEPTLLHSLSIAIYSMDSYVHHLGLAAFFFSSVLSCLRVILLNRVPVCVTTLSWFKTIIFYRCIML